MGAKTINFKKVIKNLHSSILTAKIKLILFKQITLVKILTIPFNLSQFLINWFLLKILIFIFYLANDTVDDLMD